MKSKQKYIMFNFNWTWIKDKQMIHKGNTLGGIFIIADSEGNVVKMYGYERL